MLNSTDKAWTEAFDDTEDRQQSPRYESLERVQRWIARSRKEMDEVSQGFEWAADS